MKPRISIIGIGNVGSALKKGLERVNHEEKSVGNDSTLISKLTDSCWY